VGGDGTVPPPAVQTVVVGGMPGWQIALIAVAAAVLAAAVAVFLDRARATRHHQAAPSA
jgi:anti-sigma-K factor RskA